MVLGWDDEGREGGWVGNCTCWTMQMMRHLSHWPSFPEPVCTHSYAVVPLIFPHLSSHALFLIACAVTAVTLFLMGAVKVRQQQQQQQLS